MFTTYNHCLNQISKTKIIKRNTCWGFLRCNDLDTVMMHTRQVRNQHTPPLISSLFWDLFLLLSSESYGSILSFTVLEKIGLHFLTLWRHLWWATLRKSNPLEGERYPENGALLIFPLSGWSWILSGQPHWLVDIMFIVSCTQFHNKIQRKYKTLLDLATEKKIRYACS
jgi:hypothetical protein